MSIQFLFLSTVKKIVPLPTYSQQFRAGLPAEKNCIINWLKSAACSVCMQFGGASLTLHASARVLGLHVRQRVRFPSEFMLEQVRKQFHMMAGPKAVTLCLSLYTCDGVPLPVSQWYPVPCNLGASKFRFDMFGSPNPYW